MVAQSKYLQTLIKDVMDNSDSNDWDSAVTEWEISDVEENELLEESCICGKEHLRYLFTIENQLNGNVLYPIGSSCIKKFERDDLKYEVDVKEQLFKLLHAVEDNEFLQLSSEFFSRKLLRYLFEVGAFKATKWNNFEPEKDYEFMIDMFNKRNRTENQNKKAVAIILTSIKPFLQEKLAHKVKNR
ncbi:hypothetical protein [Streptococcus gallolyticus]|uniref:hypothetical protein n=1 Tax=Streptococcus gallolyticus TaxID=315405 RepID=UPI003D2FF36A